MEMSALLLPLPLTARMNWTPRRSGPGGEHVAVLADLIQGSAFAEAGVCRRILVSDILTQKMFSAMYSSRSSAASGPHSARTAASSPGRRARGGGSTFAPGVVGVGDAELCLEVQPVSSSVNSRWVRSTYAGECRRAHAKLGQFVSQNLARVNGASMKSTSPRRSPASPCVSRQAEPASAAACGRETTGRRGSGWNGAGPSSQADSTSVSIRNRSGARVGNGNQVRFDQGPADVSLTRLV